MDRETDLRKRKVYVKGLKVVLLLAVLLLCRTGTEASAAARVFPESTPGTPFGEHGALRVEGPSLVDAKGEKYQLTGVSTHGVAWFPQYVNLEAFRTLRDGWGVNCIRLAMYTEEYGGYCSGGNQEELKELLDRGVSYAEELGMYVIVDWHILRDGDPNIHKKEALDFFDEMAEKWKDYDHVLYEICNEPNGPGGWEEVKSYAREVIPVIRRHDSGAVVITGTPVWCQEINRALEDPLEYGNIMYSLHFYAASHTDWLRERCARSVEQGLPVFISEFGLCDASGNGENDFWQAAAWMELIEKYNLSCCCWNLANKNEKSSILQPGCTKISGWEEGDLSESGKWIQEWFKNAG